MEIQGAIFSLRNSKEFKNWSAKDGNTDSYLTHVLVITQSPDSLIESQFQAGFFSVKRDRITSFLINSDGTIVQGEESEVFKQKGEIILPVALDNTIKTHGDALIIAKNEIESAECSLGQGCNIDQNIIVLQNLKELGHVWNVTFVLNHVKLLNVKIDSVTGVVKQKSVTSLFDMIDKHK